MTPHVVVLGGGTGGTLVANRLRRRHRADDLAVTVVDQDDRHVYQPGLLFVPFGLATAEEITRPRSAQLLPGVTFRQAPVARVDTGRHAVVLGDGDELHYDVAVVASGSVLQPEETDGLLGPGWGERVFTFYDLDGATALARALAAFDRGRLVVNIVDLPIKCPVAPLEFCFLADWFLTERHIRRDVAITLATPLDGAFTTPVASRRLGALLEEKGVELVTEFNTGEVDGAGGHLVGYDGRRLPFDLAVVVPLHGGAPFVAASPGLGDEVGFVAVDPHTLQARADPDVFAIGDAAGVPTSKAGSVTHFEGEVVTANIEDRLAGRALRARYDGHTNCFIETGFGKAVLIDFNYDHEPGPGHYPGPAGLPLLKEARLNHLGKLMFQWLYWHGLLPGRDVPGIGSAMPTAGKRAS